MEKFVATKTTGKTLLSKRCNGSLDGRCACGPWAKHLPGQ